MSFDDLLTELQGQKTAQEDPNHVPLRVLFNDAFMKNHTRWGTFDEFLEKGNFQVNVLEDVNNIPDEFLDRHVARETDFSDWDTMLEVANKEHAAKA
ncbi:hypothetical protein [Paenibacillus shirakamiensis]|nr:hypothetical protein [Paenibacillus shirakamiensis]